MALTQLAPPYPVFTDKNGDPLDNGYLYFGEVDKNPETNPIQVYYDNAFTQPAAQPLRTSNGYVMRNGSPALIYADSQFSVTSRDKSNALVIYSPTGYGITPGTSASFASQITILDPEGFYSGPSLQDAIDDISTKTFYPNSLAILKSDTKFSYTNLSAGDLVVTRSENYAYEVAASGAIDQHLTTSGGVKLYVSANNVSVTPRMFGAVGDGTTDDVLSMGACWDFAGANDIPVYMEGLEYDCSESVFTSSNLTIYGEGAVMYITAWPAVGGFVNNVRPVEAARVQSNIRIYDLILDGSKLPAPLLQNSNLLGFARGASNIRIENCTGRKMRDGSGGGTGGGAFGVEQGGTNIFFIGCVAEDCYRGFRVAGFPGNHASGESKIATNIVVRDFTARRCGTAVFAHSVGEGTGDTSSNLGIFDAVFDGMYIEDCGHYPWRDFDYAAYPTILPQKTGAINFGGAQNIRMRAIRVKLNSGYPELFTDWLGRTGYPATGSYIGVGLSGPIGALVWGWGRNIVIEDITLDGSVDTYWTCARAITFGDLATVTPAYITSEVKQVVFEAVRHVRPGIYQYVFDGQVGANGGLDNALFSGRMNIEPSSSPTLGIIGPTGTSTLSNLFVSFISNLGKTQDGNAVQWVAAGNARPISQENRYELGGYETGGGYSATGASDGQSYDAVDGILRSSRDVSTFAYHHGFYNPNGLVGGITTTGSATTFATSSDARLKDDFREFDGLGMLANVQVYDHAWLTGGRGLGVIAQELAEIIPGSVSIGDNDEDWNAKGIGDRVPWSVDYSKLVPLLIRAIQQLEARIKKGDL